MWDLQEVHEDVYYEKEQNLCMDFKFLLHQNKFIILILFFHERFEIASYIGG